MAAPALSVRQIATARHGQGLVKPCRTLVSGDVGHHAAGPAATPSRREQAGLVRGQRQRAGAARLPAGGQRLRGASGPCLRSWPPGRSRERGGGIEQPSDGGRLGTVEPALPGRLASRPVGHPGRATPVSQHMAAALRQGSRPAASPPGRRKGRKLATRSPRAGAAEESLAAPQGAVPAVAHAVPGKYEQRSAHRQLQPPVAEACAW